jgi:IS30 family transposase
VDLCWALGSRRITGSSAKGKRQNPAETRGKFAIGRSISDRPKEVRSRETFGHWELDTVVSGRGKSKGCVATLIERKTRLYTAVLMPDRTALSMEIALGVASHSTPQEPFSEPRLTEERSLHAMPIWKRPITCTFILLIHIRLGNAVQMRMQMDCFESFSRKAPISLKLRMKISPVH